MAVESYTKAMELDPHSAVMSANRAMALIKLERYIHAVTVHCVDICTLQARQYEGTHAMAVYTPCSMLSVFISM